ncbi:KilA-N domain-containing protein [Pedobacter nutrimenti]|uniref:KilA-N domain-containing protein n=1 Tax=Pedobacter nutrimenti TaxID=1241337 RepID=UPI00292F13C6|nr:KilA-N domain-containing protein [Pedobacter nutrimenti]
MKEQKQSIPVKGIDVSILQKDQLDYISLSSIAFYKDRERTDYIIQNWLRNRSTIDFVGLWELLHNSNFNSIEFDGIKMISGTNSFSLTPKRWIERTNAIGLIAKAGRYGGTFAHKDIAFEFASWISPEFKLYLIKEFQRLKDEENSNKNLNWNLQRTLAKINYKIHTDAIKETLIPLTINKQQKNHIYADEADLLNVAMFGQTAKQWRDSHSSNKGNIRDIATIEQLVVLSNLESINAVFIKQGLSQIERLERLNEIAIIQMRSLLTNPTVKQLS